MERIRAIPTVKYVPQERLRAVRLFAMDFDGIHTDGTVYVDQNGTESVRCSRIDSLGLELIRRNTDIERCVISKETNPVVAARCKKLKLPCHQAIDTGEGKLEILQRVMTELSLVPAQVLYMGDDVNDIPVLRFVGIPVAVPHAPEVVKSICSYVTNRPAGNGALREICDMILAARGVELAI